MAKSTKFSSKVPALDDYKLPSWINEEGEVTDLEAAKKALHTLALDKAKAQDAREDALAEAKEVAVERDTLQTELDSKADPDSAAKIAKLEKDLSSEKAKSAKAELDLARVEIAAEKGLTPKQAKRLAGENREELEADADELIEDLGLKPGSNNETDDDDDDDDEATGRTRPKSQVRLTNGGDTNNSADAEPDYDAIAAQLAGNRVL